MFVSAHTDAAELNAVTKAALAEYGEMQRNPGAYPRYRSFDELSQEVLEEWGNLESP